MTRLKHSYAFDPGYGYSTEQLLRVGAPDGPADFSEFWGERYERTLTVDPKPSLKLEGSDRHKWVTHELRYTSTEETAIGGWCLVPQSGEVERVFVVLHGYGGRTAPDYHLPLGDTSALLFPCARGISRSPHPRIPSEPSRHVLYGIDSPETYVIGGCVEDVWVAISAAQILFPKAKERIGLLGISFGGGIGAMALACDTRISRAHFNVPTFGNQPLRLKLETTGSGAAVRRYHHQKPELVKNTLSYFDAATAARNVRVPVHYACALFDPMVAPPGQFAVHNATPDRKLFVLQAGHFEYPGQSMENHRLLRDIHGFFEAV